MFRLIEKERHGILFLQENMGAGDTLITDHRKTLVHWDFSFVDSSGLSKGSITCWNNYFRLINYFCVYLGICTNI